LSTSAELYALAVVPIDPMKAACGQTEDDDEPLCGNASTAAQFEPQPIHMMDGHPPVAVTVFPPWMVEVANCVVSERAVVSERYVGRATLMTVVSAVFAVVVPVTTSVKAQACGPLMPDEPVSLT